MRLSSKIVFVFLVLWAHSSYAVDYYTASSSQAGQPNLSCTAFQEPYGQFATAMQGVECIASILQIATGNDYTPTNCITLDTDGNLQCNYVVTPPGGPAYPGYSTHVATTSSYMAPTECAVGVSYNLTYGEFYAYSESQLTLNQQTPICYQGCELTLTNTELFKSSAPKNCFINEGKQVCDTPPGYSITYHGATNGQVCSPDTPPPTCDTCETLSGNGDPLPSPTDSGNTNETSYDNDIVNNPDGTTTQTETTTNPDGSQYVRVTERDASGNITNITNRGTLAATKVEIDLGGDITIGEGSFDMQAVADELTAIQTELSTTLDNAETSLSNAFSFSITDGGALDNALVTIKGEQFDLSPHTAMQKWDWVGSLVIAIAALYSFIILLGVRR